MRNFFNIRLLEALMIVVFNVLFYVRHTFSLETNPFFAIYVKLGVSFK